MLVMIRGNVTVETVPVGVSIPHVLEKTIRAKWEKRTPRADTKFLEHSPSGSVCAVTVEVVMILVEVSVENRVRVGVG
jgi:hypothetical protein